MAIIIDTAPIPIAHDPRLFAPCLRLINPPMIPIIPNKNGIVNNERMETIKAMLPAIVPKPTPFVSSVRSRSVCKMESFTRFG